MGRGVDLIDVRGPRPALVRDFGFAVGSGDDFLEEWALDVRDCNCADDLGGTGCSSTGGKASSSSCNADGSEGVGGVDGKLLLLLRRERTP